MAKFFLNMKGVTNSNIFMYDILLQLLSDMV